MLNYIRALVKDIKGEILKDSYKVSLKESCEALQIKLLQCFIGSHFWKIYWKKFAAKITLLVKLRSAISNKIKTEPRHRCFPDLSYLSRKVLDI